MEIADLYAVCGTNRPKIAEQFTRNLIQTSQCHIVLVANPKIKVFTQLDEFVQKLKEKDRKRVTLHFSPYVIGLGQAVNFGWAKLREEIGNDRNILAFMCGDDYEFYDGWYEAALACYEKFFPDRDGLMFLRDLAVKGGRNWGGPAIVTAKFCDLYMGGWLAPPWYITSGIDTEHVGLAKKHNKLAFCEEAEVRHLLYQWPKTHDSEQRKLAILVMQDRPKRGWIYDIEAPWRYWR